MSTFILDTLLITHFTFFFNFKCGVTSSMFKMLPLYCESESHIPINSFFTTTTTTTTTYLIYRTVLPKLQTKNKTDWLLLSIANDQSNECRLKKRILNSWGICSFLALLWPPPHVTSYFQKIAVIKTVIIVPEARQLFEYCHL